MHVTKLRIVVCDVGMAKAQHRGCNNHDEIYLDSYQNEEERVKAFFSSFFLSFLWFVSLERKRENDIVKL